MQTVGCFRKDGERGRRMNSEGGEGSEKTERVIEEGRKEEWRKERSMGEREGGVRGRRVSPTSPPT